MITAENVLANPLAFKANLAIGEDAYTSLKYGKGLQGLWDSLGIGATAAGIAKTSTVAALIGSKTGWFAAIGIGAFFFFFLPGYFFLLPSGSEVPEMVAPTDEESES